MNLFAALRSDQNSKALLICHEAVDYCTRTVLCVSLVCLHPFFQIHFLLFPHIFSGSFSLAFRRPCCLVTSGRMMRRVGRVHMPPVGCNVSPHQLKRKHSVGLVTTAGQFLCVWVQKLEKFWKHQLFEHISKLSVAVNCFLHLGKEKCYQVWSKIDKTWDEFSHLS